MPKYACAWSMTIIAAAKKRSEVSAGNFGVAGRLSVCGSVGGTVTSVQGGVTGLSRVAIIHTPKVPCRTAAHLTAYGVGRQGSNVDAAVRTR